jgi:large repetitive protein
VCSLSGSTVSFTGVGTCTLRADQAGNANWAAAPQATQSFAVAKAPQSITFTSTPPTVDGSVYLYNVSATATSGLSVDFGTTTSGVCSVIGSWVWFHGDGTCLVHADQAGDANWAAAPRQTQSILVTGHG